MVCSLVVLLGSVGSLQVYTCIQLPTREKIKPLALRYVWIARITLLAIVQTCLNV